jgi:hypothetical protein
LRLRGVVQKIKKFAPRIDVNIINKLYGAENQVDKGPLAVPLATFLVAIRYVRFTSIAGVPLATAVGAVSARSRHAVGRSAQFCSGVVEKWRARQDETGHSYVIVISTVV